jgi:3',5'-cyclic AMP phosphodiesterase CpdA
MQPNFCPHRKLRYLLWRLLLPTVFLPLLLLGASLSLCSAQITIAQLSDTHLGEKRAPDAADNLRRAVEMINARQPDAVVLSGDIGEDADEWEEAKTILKDLTAPLYYAPGNHDVHTSDVQKYRAEFGADYYRFQVKDVTFLVIDSELLGNYETYEAKSPPPLPSNTAAEAKRMLKWLKQQRSAPGSVVIGIQHIPPIRDNDFPPDTKPYWVMSDPYRSHEIDILHKLNVKDMLVGHWHNARVYNWEGINWHVAPATSWLPWGGELGFDMHDIATDGTVTTEFVPLTAD